MKKLSALIEAFATIVGMVVGLGIFAIPYAAKNVGVVSTVALIVFVTVVMIFLSVLFAEIVLFDNREECVISYAKRYLGRWAEVLQTCSVFFGYIGSILAYLLAMAVFVQAIIPSETIYFWPIILFYTALTCIVLLNGVRSLGNLEIVLGGTMCAIFLFVSLGSLPHWKEIQENWKGILIPYGVVWFALTGGSAIPVAVSILNRNGKKILKIIWLSYIFIAFITILFFVAVLKTGGTEVGPNPFLVMGEKMGSWVRYVGSFLGILAVVTSHWVLATYLKRILVYDLKMEPVLGWFLTVFFPIVLILIGVSNFIHVIGLVGVVAGTTDALLVLTIYKKIFSRKNVIPRVLPIKVPGGVIWVVFLLLVGAALSSIFTAM